MHHPTPNQSNPRVRWSISSTVLSRNWKNDSEDRLLVRFPYLSQSKVRTEQAYVVLYTSAPFTPPCPLDLRTQVITVGNNNEKDSPNVLDRMTI